MSRRRTTASLARVVEANPAPAAPIAPVDDCEQLARELGRSFTEQLADYRAGAKQTDPVQPVDASHVDMIMRQSPEDFTFMDLERLAAADPDNSRRKWEEVKAAARRDLGSGWLAGRAVERLGGNAWLRAQFLAVRAALHETWRPRNGGEALILDRLAQYEMLHQQWLATTADYSNQPGAAIQRPVHFVQALREAAHMVELWQRLFHITLAAFLRMRRTPGPVVFARGQVNVTAGPQLNVQAAMDDTHT